MSFSEGSIFKPLLRVFCENWGVAELFIHGLRVNQHKACLPVTNLKEVAVPLSDIPQGWFTALNLFFFFNTMCLHILVTSQSCSTNVLNQLVFVPEPKLKPPFRILRSEEAFISLNLSSWNWGQMCTLNKQGLDSVDLKKKSLLG